MSNEPLDPYNLARFVQAQASDYERALGELRAGKKRTHWSWYILPQLQGLGSSGMSTFYAIKSIAEARAYIGHPLLGPRLKECVAAMNALPGVSATQVLGDVDAAKFRSCLTLFSQVEGLESLFGQALNRYFQGEPDRQTLALLAAQRGEPGEA